MPEEAKKYLSPRQAAELLRLGEVVSFPTETVYGLGADAANPLAVRRVYALKGRPLGHPLIVHLHSLEDAGRWCVLTEEARLLAEAFWPGPMTLILERGPGVADEVTAGLDTVGIRIPSHPVARELLKAFGGGIAAPSANRFGRISPTSTGHVLAEFGRSMHVLDGGQCEIGIESTIVDLVQGPAILRPGKISREELEACIGPLRTGSTTIAPGTLKAHYSPRTSLHLTDSPGPDAEAFRKRGLAVEVLFAPAPGEYAQILYSMLRKLDRSGVDILVAERCEPAGIGIAVNDRLQRAAAGAKVAFTRGENGD